MIVREKVTLSDGKEALKITGLGPSPFNIRVKRTHLETKPNGSLTDTIIRAAAYSVSDAGAEITCGPEVTINVHASGDFARALATLSAHAQTAFLSTYAASVQVVPDNLPL